jgi:DNA-binding response OmpR family regulator
MTNVLLVDDSVSIRKFKQLKTLDAYEVKPVLVLTTEMNADKKRTVKQAGASGWIVKPSNLSSCWRRSGSCSGSRPPP